MTQHSTTPKARSTQWQWWEKVARRIRVPLGFVTAAVYLVGSGAARAASGCHSVEPGAGSARPGATRSSIGHGEEKPRAHGHRTLCLHAQPALSGLDAHSRRFCVGAAKLAGGAAGGGGFAAIYVPVIASEERFLRATFAGVRRLLPPRAALHPALYRCPVR